MAYRKFSLFPIILKSYFNHYDQRYLNHIWFRLCAIKNNNYLINMMMDGITPKHYVSLKCFRDENIKNNIIFIKKQNVKLDALHLNYFRLTLQAFE